MTKNLFRAHLYLNKQMTKFNLFPTSYIIQGVKEEKECILFKKITLEHNRKVCSLNKANFLTMKEWQVKGKWFFKECDGTTFQKVNRD